MKVIMVMVATLNGKITRGRDSDIYSWTSREDADFFFTLLNHHSLIVMGSATYEAAKKKIIPDKKRLRIVLTKNPKKYLGEEVKGKLEFTSESPENLCKRLQKEKYETMLLVGGGTINAAFLRSKLVNELYLTLEPKIFGTGLPLVANGTSDTEFQLLSSKKLNAKGTILLHYRVLQ